MKSMEATGGAACVSASRLPSACVEPSADHVQANRWCEFSRFAGRQVQLLLQHPTGRCSRTPCKRRHRWLEACTTAILRWMPALHALRAVACWVCGHYSTLMETAGSPQKMRAPAKLFAHCVAVGLGATHPFSPRHHAQAAWWLLPPSLASRTLQRRWLA
jgi:hypothetical protein